MKQLRLKNKKNERIKFKNFCFLTFFNALKYVQYALHDMSQKLNLTKNMTKLLKEKLLHMYGINSKLGQFF